MEVEQLERFCRRPSSIRLLLAIDGEVKQDDIYRRGPIPAGAFYGALKELISLGLVRREKRDVYYILLTERGKKVKRLLEELAVALSESE